MADETDTITNVDTPAIPETSIAPKKQRKPRASKVSSKRTGASTAAEPAISRQKRRGRKAKAIEGAAITKRTPVKNAPKAEQAEPVVPRPVGDEMADLVQLEEENQELRKLLAEKLRAENAELRKKLKLG